MANIFTLENIDDFSEKISIDELYEKKRQSDLNTLALFNKILNRIHVRIKTVSNQRKNEQFCWYVIPEVIIGVPKYDQGACIAYVMEKLTSNGFNVRYIHPNTLFISWLHFVPSYVRSEIKKKTGIIIDEYGKKIDEGFNNKIINESYNENELLFNVKDDNQNSSQIKQQNKKDYTPIKSYKPLGNLLYNDELLNKIEDKFS
jgi:hypothetical protein